MYNNRKGIHQMETNNKANIANRVKLTLAAAAIVAVTAFVSIGGFGKEQVHAETVKPDGAKHVIAVQGKAELKVEPDVAYINVSVQTSGATAKEAQTKNASKFAAIQRVLFDNYKLTKQDVQTTSFYVNPEYSYSEKEGQKLTGYSAIHGIQITYRNLDQIGIVLDSLSVAGANRVEGVQFALENKDAIEKKALEQAMANAKGKAETLAAAADQQLLGVLTVSQGAPVSVRTYSGVMEKAMYSATADMSSTTVQSGQVSYSTEISVEYEIK
jgi:uncharacterized protein